MPGGSLRVTEKVLACYEGVNEREDVWREEGERGLIMNTKMDNSRQISEIINDAFFILFLLFLIQITTLRSVTGRCKDSVHCSGVSAMILHL